MEKKIMDSLYWGASTRTQTELALLARRILRQLQRTGNEFSVFVQYAGQPRGDLSPMGFLDRTGRN
jgi:hypothetical protein